MPHNLAEKSQLMNGIASFNDNSYLFVGHLMHDYKYLTKSMLGQIHSQWKVVSSFQDNIECRSSPRDGMDWFFLGTPGYGAPYHTDEVKNPSWQAQISGVKTW